MASKAKAKTNGNGKSPLAQIAPTVVQIAKPVVVPSGAPSIVDNLPEWIGLPPRCTFADSPPEHLAAVLDAFHMDRGRDKRLELLTEEDMRGHHATKIAAPRAAMVRSGNSPLVTLAIETAAHLGQTRDLRIAPVASFYMDQPGKLPRNPHRAEHALTQEAMARVRECWGDVSADAAFGLYAPMDPSRFAETSAERVEVEGALYKLASTSCVLWVAFQGLIWPVAILRGAAMRRAEEPSNTYTVEEWNRRSNSEAGIL